MSANSIKDVEAALLRRYGDTYGRNDQTFQADFGVSWAKLKDTIAREVAAERAEIEARQLGKGSEASPFPFPQNSARDC
jgi:hypothetical protein